MELNRQRNNNMDDNNSRFNAIIYSKANDESIRMNLN